ncbi:hypothetical protein [Streptomyces sp. TP-A0874]|uniref:hypothetical protein n=1 Tax=Streptomyces sp. TP-A0874 TaxID=549819 RepID=UPI0014806907|nr:hypothetical protein [Streptomyces sp. TP-A0874]
MTTFEKTAQSACPAEGEDGHPQRTELRGPDNWGGLAPIQLAGYEDDPAEPHILRGID